MRREEDEMVDETEDVEDEGILGDEEEVTDDDWV